MPSSAVIQHLWTLSLIVLWAFVLLSAVALTSILLTVRRLHDSAEAMWTVGQQIGRKTTHVALLTRMNDLVARIDAAARGTATAVSVIERHARVCPQCPSCVTDAGTRRG